MLFDHHAADLNLDSSYLRTGQALAVRTNRSLVGALRADVSLHALLRSLFHQHQLHLSDVYCLCGDNTGYIFLKNDGFVFYQTK
jgi:hypothetical protein